MIWLMSGSRSAPEAEVNAILNALQEVYGLPSRLFHGRANGADTHAESWAFRKGIHAPGTRALWDAFGKAAGSKRNSVILQDALDLAVFRNEKLLFVAMPGPQSRGTYDMCAQFDAARKTCDVSAVVHIFGVSR